jgi:plasmid stability protein
MAAIQIRDVPAEVRDALAERAAQAHQSLQGYLLDLLVGHVRQPQPRDFARLAPLRTGVSDAVGVDTIAAIVLAGREGRDEERQA